MTQHTHIGPTCRAGCPSYVQPDGGSVERIAINAATQATLRPSAPELPEVWCSRCDQPSVTTIGDEAACAMHAIELAAERLLRFENSDERTGLAWHDAVADMQDALRHFRAASAVPQNPSPEVIEAARRAGAYAL